MSLSEQEEQRRKSREEIIDLGIDPYPSDTFEVNTYTDEIKNNFYIEDTYFSSEYINVSFHIRVENPKDTDHAFHLRETVYDLDKEFNRHKNIIKYIKDENSDKKIHLHIHSQEDEDRYHNFYQFCLLIFPY